MVLKGDKGNKTTTREKNTEKIYKSSTQGENYQSVTTEKTKGEMKV
jgi:hypothetical protein